MIRKYLAIGFSLISLGLFGCDRQERSPLQPEAKGPKGAARIALPKLPSGYVDTTKGQQALFALEPHYVRASEPERNPKFPPLPGPPAQSRIRED